MGTNFIPLPGSPWQGFTFPGGQAAKQREAFTELLRLENEDDIDDEFLILELSDQRPQALGVNVNGDEIYLDREQARTLANSILLWLNEENKKDETHG
jgi:hypothetical protein